MEGRGREARYQQGKVQNIIGLGAQRGEPVREKEIGKERRKEKLTSARARCLSSGHHRSLLAASRTEGCGKRQRGEFLCAVGRVPFKYCQCPSPTPEYISGQFPLLNASSPLFLLHGHRTIRHLANGSGWNPARSCYRTHGFPMTASEDSAT